MWPNILFGTLQAPKTQTIQEDEPYGSAKCRVSSSIPWDILRVALLWNIWVQKCDEELNGNQFSLGKVLFYAWQTTIHVGMEVWVDIYHHGQTPEHILQMSILFIKI
jgi:hypothetical protein